MSDIQKAEPDSALPAAMPEVEFALVLSRVIETMKQDPAQLRQNIYELARLKLRRDLLQGDPQEAGRLKQALETAIAGVEAFSQKQDVQPHTYVSHPAIAPPAGHSNALLQIDHSLRSAGAYDPGIEDGVVEEPRADRRSGRSSRHQPAAWSKFRFGIGVAVLVLILCGAGLRYTGLWSGIGGSTKGTPALAAKAVQPSVVPAATSAAPAAVTTSAEPPRPDFPIPTTYGTYAISNGKLSELEVLPGQVPDRRVAMSAPITTPSHTTIPDGSPAFVIFRRDLASLGQDRIEARVVARITRTLKFGADNKPTTTAENNVWTIRNIAYQFRIAPVPGHPEMIVLRPENPEPLPPGRYVLSLKRQPYDFTVAGAVKDPDHCLERTEAANGIFYSPCKTP
ncbi:hypothetical protein ACSVBT_09945 [Afipia sp. TerB]